MHTSRMQLKQVFFKELIKNGFSEEDIRFLDVEEILRKQIGNKTLSEFSKLHKINSGTLSHMLKGKRAVPLSLLKELDALKNRRCVIKNGNVPVLIPDELTPKLAYLIGFLRDGTVTKETENEYCCAFYNSNTALLKKVSRIINDIFGIKPKIRRFGDNFGIRIRSFTLYLFFKLVFEVANRQVLWNTPTLIKNAQDDIKRAYVTGFFDAEGGCPHFERNIDTKRKNLYAKFVQKNKESLEFIKEYLDSKGIQTRSVYLEKNKHVLKISNKSIKSFSKFIKPLHPVRAKNLYKLSKLFS